MWCDLWVMKLNASKTKTVLVFSSRAIQPQPTPLKLDGILLKESLDLVILWVTFEAKMTFEKQLLSVSRAAAQGLGIMRNFWQVFYDQPLF